MSNSLFLRSRVMSLETRDPRPSRYAALQLELLSVQQLPSLPQQSHTA